MVMKIAVAMSGGVDSSSAAALLKEQRHELVGFTMQLWNQRRNINVDENGDPLPSRCCSHWRSCRPRSADEEGSRARSSNRRLKAGHRAMRTRVRATLLVWAIASDCSSPMQLIGPISSSPTLPFLLPSLFSFSSPLLCSSAFTPAACAS